MEHPDWTRDPLVQSECSIQQNNGISRDPDPSNIPNRIIKKKAKCGKCAACLKKEDCRSCLACKDKIRYGGIGKSRKICWLKVCTKPLKLKPCGVCNACNRKDDCASCKSCKDKHKFGGPAKLRKACQLKVCQNQLTFQEQNQLSSHT